MFARLTKGARMSEERLWTVTEIAERLDVHITTVQNWIRKGHFPGALKKGPGKTSPWVIPQSSLDAFEKSLGIDQLSVQE